MCNTKLCLTFIQQVCWIFLALTHSFWGLSSNTRIICFNECVHPCQKCIHFNESVDLSHIHFNDYEILRFCIYIKIFWAMHCLEQLFSIQLTDLFCKVLACFSPFKLICVLILCKKSILIWKLISLNIYS